MINTTKYLIWLFFFYSCTYRFEGQKGEKVKITIKKLFFANRTDCQTRRNPDSKYVQCVGNVTASLAFFEVPFKEAYPLAKDCLCSKMESLLPFTYMSTSHVVDLEFVVARMNFTEDYRHFFMEGTYEFFRSAICPEKRVVSGSSGELVFKAPNRTPIEVSTLIVNVETMRPNFSSTLVWFLIPNDLLH